VKPGGSEVTLSEEIALKIEEKIAHTVQGIEKTLREILEKGEISFDDMKTLLESLKPSFSLLSQKWVLEILYSLLILGPLGFNDLKRITGANSRSLSSKLKALVQEEFIERKVSETPPVKTTYLLTERGRITALLSLPLLYYIVFSYRAKNPLSLF